MQLDRVVMWFLWKGEEPPLGDITEDDMKMLHDDSIIPNKVIIQFAQVIWLYD